MNKISVKKLVDGYMAIKNSDESIRNKYLDSHLSITEYVPYSMKVGVAKEVIKNSCLGENGNVLLDSPKRYILHILSILNLYTNVEISNDAITEEYDLLVSNGLLDRITERIPQAEIERFSTIEKMEFDDFMTNMYEGHAFLTKMIVDVWNLISPSVGKLIDVTAESLKDVDIDKLAKAIKS